MNLKTTNTRLKGLILVLVFLCLGNSLFAQVNTDQNDVETYFDEARAFRNRNQIDLALQSLDKAAAIAEENKDVKKLIDSYNMFALLYLKLDKVNTTKYYWDRAKVLLEEVEYPYGDAIYKYIEAILLFRDNQNFQAIFMLNEARQLNNDRNFFNNILLTEGEIYLNLEKYESAAKNFNSLIVNTDVYEKEYLATRAYLGLAQTQLRTGNFEEAAKNATNALKLAEENGFSVEIVTGNRLLAETNEEIGNYQNALAATRNLQIAKDSLFSLEKLSLETKTADEIHSENMANEIKRQDKRIEELSKSANRSEITAILTSAFLIIISLLAVSLYRNNQIKLKTNELLHTKNSELQAARDAAVSAMEAKTNFLSTVSHELRTPLYAVTGLTHLLLEENPNKDQIEHLKALKFSGDYLLNFINDILHINKIDADKLEPLIMEFNLKKVLNEVINSLQQSAKKNQTKLILDYDESIPSHLMSDPLKLSQVFMNLIGNALKFTKNGEVTIKAEMVHKEEEDVTLYFEVKDNGIGISLEQQEKIFEGFEQGSIQINREYGGTGLGLTIVKSLLGLFDSKIKLTSEIGQGSTFYFELKLKSKDGIIDDIPFEIIKQDYDFKGLHLMIVEDNKINQVITKKMLSKKEITSDIASNGTEAIELAQKNKYDAILMDIHMPGISGEEATIEIRKFDSITPIIALTAISLDDSLESFYAAGCNDVVTKPFKPEVFYQKIGENIFGRQANTTT
ncbi:response regulator [Maribacter polysiphoniae]|uniref:histidine kinase n=1 Tax=Maribacter polysiphoniae TaxID=429344 RepID=A0A316DMM6_9FLAO|nr:ATP-binding protein [Maribacter polysiphoniae]MBD1262967.1 response regulator [Maribacter polysiphoniae]PWK19384.1 signal transduction histidine kinase [Maribacter polysiphoniae]